MADGDLALIDDTDHRMRVVLEALPAAIYITDAAGRVTFYNQAAVELSGRRPILGEDRWCVTWKLYRPDGTRLPHDQCPMAVALKEQRRVHGEEIVAERPDGTRTTVQAYPTPLFDANGVLTGAINMLVDRSDRKRADDVARRLAAIVTYSDDAIISKDTNGVIQTWNAGAERVFGYTAEEAVGKSVTILIPPERPDEEPGILARIRRGERIDHYETVRVRKDGTRIDISLSVSPLKDADGKVIGASKIARDITEQKREAERRLLLINELNHRVKNTLATVQSIAAQTFRGECRNDADKRFEGRIIALSKAHDVLTRESWEGADLGQLAASVVAAVCVRSEERFRISGPPARLTPKMAVSLSMAFHELCTNAVKYGALASEAGRVAVSWQADGPAPDRRLRLRWEEGGGPAVEPPRRRGFGTRLLERALAHELGGRVRLLFPPGGLVCEIEAPLP